VPAHTDRATRRAAGDVRIAIVAANASAMATIGDLLKTSGVELVAATSVDELREYSAPPPELVVVYVDAGSAGDEPLSRLRGMLPRARIVAVMARSAQGALRRAVSLGASGVVLESQIEAALAPTLAAVRVGQICLPAELGNGFGRPDLTVREKQVLAMVVLGFGNAEIARKLYVAQTTVKSHLASAFSKLNVRSRAQATALILDPEHGLGTGILAITRDVAEVDET
jgi:DNA-binding NarL/FixJ family response regulator